LPGQIYGPGYFKTEAEFIAQPFQRWYVALSPTTQGKIVSYAQSTNAQVLMQASNELAGCKIGYLAIERMNDDYIHTQIPQQGGALFRRGEIMGASAPAQNDRRMGMKC
jgi:hypothetical protein